MSISNVIFQYVNNNLATGNPVNWIVQKAANEQGHTNRAFGILLLGYFYHEVMIMLVSVIYNNTVPLGVFIDLYKH